MVITFVCGSVVVCSPPIIVFLVVSINVDEVGFVVSDLLLHPSDEFILINFAMPNAKSVASSFPIMAGDNDCVSRELVLSCRSLVFAKKIKKII